jgi:hypothetical protein
MAGEVAPTPVEPTIAAQKLRTLSRSIYNTIKEMGTETSPEHTERRSQAAAYYRMSRDTARRVDLLFADVKEAAKTRKASEVNREVARLESMLSRERTHSKDAFDRLYNSPSAIPAVALDQLISSARMIVDLVQSLPTSEDMPHGNMENMLRAIMAILRTGNFPGAEGLNWEEVKKNAEKESNGAAPAAVAVESGEGTGTAGVIIDFSPDT